MTHPFLSLTDSDREEMLRTIGVSSIEELFRDLPAGIRLGRDLDLEPALSEQELSAHLGELVHYEPPDSGSTIAKDEPYGEVESVKAVSDLVAPLSGEVLAVNDKVVEAPELVNEDPYGEGWLIRVRLSDPSELDALLDAATYRAHLSTL